MTEHITTWPEVASQLITAIPTYIAAIGAIVAAYLARQAVLQGKELHVVVNSRLSELVSTAKLEGHAEGRYEGKVEGRKAAVSEAREREEWAKKNPPEPALAEQRLEEIRGQI